MCVRERNSLGTVGQGSGLYGDYGGYIGVI